MALEIVEKHWGNGSADAAVIWLHGLGADGNDFLPILPTLALPSDLNVRFIFPHAPHRSITLNAGMGMRAWYDIASLALSQSQDREGIMASAEAINEQVHLLEKAGIPRSKMVLAGFSQGGSMALHMALRATESFAGVIALSSYLPLHEDYPEALGTFNGPIWMGHGEADTLVPCQLGEDAVMRLNSWGLDCHFESYPGLTHAVSEIELLSVGAFLKRVLTKKT